MNRFAKIGLLLMSMILMILPVVFGLMLYLETKGAINDSFLDSKKSKSSLRDKPVDPSLDHVSVLFLGVDDSDSRRKGGQKASQSRTDAMIYTTFNRDKKQIRMVSIPRDTLSYIPAVKYYDKITHAHAIDGPEGSMESVESTLNVPVDFYARINMEAFVEVVDELGGIEYDVPFSLNEPNTEDKGRIKVKKGKQNLTGDEALAVVRSRKQDSDLERGKRQMEMIKAIIKKAQETNSINKLDDLVKIVGKNAKHNFTFDDIQNLATTYSSSKVKIKTEQITGTDANFNGVYFYNPDLDNLLELSNKLRKDLKLPKTKKTEMMNYLMTQAYGDLMPYIEVSKKSLKSGETNTDDSSETVEPAVKPDTDESIEQPTEQPTEQPIEQQPVEQPPTEEVPSQEVPQAPQETPQQAPEQTNPGVDPSVQQQQEPNVY
ncbi:MULTISPECIES: LCP family protein [Mammaliicoccus]|uniref:LCP family protein n=2 Tax=Mammaliicoccus fleurettii TaxID=150056 RepID=A0ABS5MJV5_9STAP|nr:MULTISPECIES: LCP family protein [Mammaliicoccus]MBL0847467.1 LCP family protein [Mammaliicoccus fleurettii]MBO3063066.1 LCP family protein [Mammaliicoccus fleurettii]MBS3671657.1 LCP family protein [Mammaliicoccus fleurettii]MBS3696193.1 LCP family protein [Mammaliicoccus fleurettii]MBW0764783.1 LytR family transcriptional regulator [Mammaliicoccus fleurettii]